MKRLILTVMLAVATVAATCAQNYVVVNSEKIFKSIKKYNDAIAQLDTLAQEYQKQVDAKFREVETLYNNYMAQKTSLSKSSQQTIEQTILSREQEATNYQESLFGTEGTLMKKRIELIQPIQKTVFDAIEKYAKDNGYSLILDIAANASVLYYSSEADHTQAIIDALKQEQ